MRDGTTKSLVPRDDITSPPLQPRQMRHGNPERDATATAINAVVSVAATSGCQPRGTPLPERDRHDYHEQERHEDDRQQVAPASPPRERFNRRPAEHGGADGRQGHRPPRVVVVELAIAWDQIEELVQRRRIEGQDHGDKGQHGEEGAANRCRAIGSANSARTTTAPPRDAARK